MCIEEYIEFNNQLECDFQEYLYKDRLLLTEKKTELIMQREIALKDLNEGYHKVSEKIQQVKNSYDNQIQLIDNKLVQTAPSEIDLFCFETIIDKISKLCCEIGVSVCNDNLNWTNRQAQLKGLLEAINQAQTLKMEALPVDEIEDRLGLILDYMEDKLPCICPGNGV